MGYIKTLSLTIRQAAPPIYYTTISSTLPWLYHNARKMKLLSIISLLALSSSTLASPLEERAPIPVSVSYDQIYDKGATSLSTVACSDGSNGLLTKGFTTFNSLPHFPLIGGSPTIPGWNSPHCGKCYKLHYKKGTVNRTIFVTAIDAAPGGFNLALHAMNKLTDGQAVQLGRIEATYEPAPLSKCGM